MVSALEFSKAKDAELAWIDGIISMAESRMDVDIEEEEEEEYKLSGTYIPNSSSLCNERYKT